MDTSQAQPQAVPHVELRPVAPEDDEFLLAVYASTRAAEMALVDWSDDVKRVFLKSQSDAQRADYESNYPRADYSVVLVDGQAAGRLWVARTDEEIHLLDIAVLPEFQNRGVGTTLFGRLIEESEQTGVPLRHTVFVFNPGATRFYERLGFKKYGEAQGGMYIHMERLPGASPAPPGRHD
jgi:ribosomal protein S18 acetylase RimI-like enzyme